MITKQNTLTKKENLVQMVKFTFFSIFAGLLEIVVFTLLNELTGFPYWPSYLTALIISVLYNFTVNRRFTFKSANNIPIAMVKVFCYYCIFTPLSTIGGEYLTQNGANEYLVLAITMVTNFVTEFLYCRFFVFKDSINTNDLAKKAQSVA